MRDRRQMPCWRRQPRQESGVSSVDVASFMRISIFGGVGLWLIQCRPGSTRAIVALHKSAHRHRVIAIFLRNLAVNESGNPTIRVGRRRLSGQPRRIDGSRMVGAHAPVALRDRSFVINMMAGAEVLARVSRVINLAHSLKRSLRCQRSGAVLAHTGWKLSPMRAASWEARLVADWVWDSCCNRLRLVYNGRLTAVHRPGQIAPCAC